MLTINPDKRTTIVDLLQDPWLTKDSKELIKLFEVIDS
jgi:hypothetical protein